MSSVPNHKPSPSYSKLLRICNIKTMAFPSILTAALLLGLVLLCIGALTTITIMIRTSLVCWNFRRASRGSVRIAPNMSLVFGHFRSLYFKPNLNKDLAELHSKLGKSFCCIGAYKPTVISIDLDLIKTVVIDEQSLHLGRFWINTPIKQMIEDNIFTTGDGAQWRRLRRAIAPALRSNKFKTDNVERQIHKSIDKLIQLIEQRLDESPESDTTKTITLEADDYCHRYSLDLVLNCFYKQDNLVDFKAPKDPLVELIDTGLKSVFSSTFFLTLTAFVGFLNPLIHRAIVYLDPLGAWSERIMHFISLQTRDHMEAKRRQAQGGHDHLEEGKGNEMVDYIIDQYRSGKLTSKEYFHSSWFLFGAADKTSAETITNVLYQLALNEDTQTKLRQEVARCGPQSDYLLWTINESLRLMPPAPLGATRTLERDVESPDGQYVVPEGSYLLTPIYLIHRLEEYWGADAHLFRPERFADQKSFHPCQFMPFGAGLKQCPGKEFALYETRLLLSQLVARYKFSCTRKLDDGFDSPYFIFTLPHQPTHLSIQRL